VDGWRIYVRALCRALAATRSRSAGGVGLVLGSGCPTSCADVIRLILDVVQGHEVDASRMDSWVLPFRTFSGAALLWPLSQGSRG